MNVGRPKGSKNKAKTAPIVGFEKEREAWDKAAEQAAIGEKKGRQAIIPFEGPREERIEMILTRKMDEAEKVDAALEAAKARAELDRRAKAVEKAKLEHKENVLKIQNPEGSKTHAELTELAARLSAEVDSGEREALTPCRKVLDARRMTVAFYRLDRGDPELGEQFNEREMTARELQAETFAAPETIEIPSEEEDEEEGPSDS